LLVLSNNSIGDAGARNLAVALPRLTALKYLYLDGNSSGATGMAAIRTAVRGGCRVSI
jgi:hypothetical protein